MVRVERGPWAQEMDDFVRAFSGAYIFGIPLLFTMEMWWIGEYGDLWKLLVFLAVGFLVNLGLTYAAGFKRESTFRSTFNQAVDAMAVGVVAALAMLLVLNRIRPDAPLDSVLGMIVVQAIPLSIGASVANEIFGKRGEKQRQGESDGSALKPWQELFSDVGATAFGGIFIGFSIAPTEEIPMLAAGLGYIHLAVLVAFSLLLSYAIVFVSGFDGEQPEGLFQHPVTETTLAYIVSIAVSALILFLFDQIGPDDPTRSMIEQTLVLALPTTIGGAAGRLVI
jgi:putative integral membrane protein (TIGR02587 family)